MSKRLLIVCAVLSISIATMAVAANAASPTATPTVTPHWVTGLAAGSGSTVGPDGALYVPDPSSGKIYRVDPDTGTRTEVAHCLPPRVIGLGGAMDVAFIGNTLYGLVSIVSDTFGPVGIHPNHNGIYRVDGPSSCTIVADIGAFALAHKPNADIFLFAGVQYAMEPYRGGFIVTDGHHNRVYRVTLDGAVSEFITFGNVVPTGLEVHGNTIYMAEAGHAPHHPEDGKVVAFSKGSSTADVVASGARLLVDVERGHGNTLFALSQGDFPPCDEASGQCAAMAGTPALHNTGSLVKVDDNGTLTEIAGTKGLDQPTSLEIIGTTAYVVTLGGEIWKIEHIFQPADDHGSPGGKDNDDHGSQGGKDNDDHGSQGSRDDDHHHGHGGKSRHN
jgi:hypothetical protein